ncbi:MAG TPA: thiamine phosphate synthase [Gammaproteobacteria bacterium]|nr:thiamine phosphate synthase [Gammaproteobacteria bacterium]
MIPPKRTKLFGLYLITPDLNDTILLENQVHQALSGGARLIQYRNKGKDAKLKQLQAHRLRELCDTHQALLIINDDPALAFECQADGVHLGQSDAHIAAARQQLGDNAIIGVTCHDRLDLALQAAKLGADYLSFGRFFPSDTKPSAPPADLSILTRAKATLTLPIAAIGGITLEHIPALLAAGADLIAICAGVFSHADITQQTQKITHICLSPDVVASEAKQSRF